MTDRFDAEYVYHHDDAIGDTWKHWRISSDDCQWCWGIYGLEGAALLAIGQVP